MNSYRRLILGAGFLVMAGTWPARAATLSNTGYIVAPRLVSAGMAGVLAFVPAQAGAAYQWSITGGTLAGIARNAAVTFNAGLSGVRTVHGAMSAESAIVRPGLF